MKFAQTVYATHDDWGSMTVYADYDTMQNVIANLIKSGGDEWSSIDIGDCTEWELVQVVNGVGLYEEQHARRSYYVALKPNGDEYTELLISGVAQFWNNKAAAIDELNS